MEDNIIKDIRNIFKIKREFFEHEEEDYCKPVKVGNFWINNFIEYGV